MDSPISVEEVLQKYGYIPQVNDIIQLLIDLFFLIGKIALCVFLIILTIPILILVTTIFIITGEFPPVLAAYLFMIVMTYDSNCPPGNPLLNWLSPLKTIHKLSEINDITNLVRDCPCLQE